jgi:hypothetical protein
MLHVIGDWQSKNWPQKAQKDKRHKRALPTPTRNHRIILPLCILGSSWLCLVFLCSFVPFVAIPANPVFVTG